MEELIDLIATDGSPSDVSDAIKQLLYTKSAEKVDNVRPAISALMFGDESNSVGDDE
jgi:hypothetical protein